MRTSPQHLVAILEIAHYEEPVILRSADLNSIVGKLAWREAYARACQGEIEGVGTRSNPVKYFRVLPESERPEMPPIARKGQPVYRTREPIGAALIPFYEEHCGEFLVGTLCRVAKGGSLRRWHSVDGVPDWRASRFNPDRLPKAQYLNLADMTLKQIAQQKSFGQGKSKSAERRRKEEAAPVTLHSTHAPGDTVTMSRDANYDVAKDGSYRRV